MTLERSPEANCVSIIELSFSPNISLSQEEENAERESGGERKREEGKEGEMEEGREKEGSRIGMNTE